jgi:cyclophilin family peptidyl-prolyl cis-trans isomerase
MKTSIVTATAAIVMIGAAALAACSTPDRDLLDGLYAEIETEKGDIVIELFDERSPATVMNFVGLAEGELDNTHAPGEPYFDGLTFHRVEPGFVIQGGDPSGDGSGGPGYRFPTETHPELVHDKAGVVAMANSGPDTNGSQFYITMAPTPHLDGGYNVFGEVVEGMEVVSSIEAGDRMRRVSIHRVGDEASEYEASQEAFDALVADIRAEREHQRAAARRAALDALREEYPGLSEYEDTGLLLAEVRPGSGALPQQGDEVAVHIVWSLPDGRQLDSTRDRGQPERFVYLQNRLIRGLEIAVGTMRVGERTVAVVPPELWGGNRPPIVPDDSYVVFDIERLE